MKSSDLQSTIGFDRETHSSLEVNGKMIEFINLQLAAMGEPIFGEKEDYPFLQMGQSLMAHYQAKDRFRGELRSPADVRIQDWLRGYLEGLEGEPPLLPGKTFTLGSHGVARTLSLPGKGDVFSSDIVESYRVANGVLHNPRSDRRTTKGVFHVAEGGLPVPNDKKAVPRATFAKLLEIALDPPREMMLLPITSRQSKQAHAWVSLLLRPVVCPAVPPFLEERRMEIRFFAPGNLVSNLDFVESIFGNAGDPYLPENDAGLDVNHWSGHTGCVILAPHLTRVTKVEVGLPHVSEATERQKRDGMCWESEEELYNGGTPFKLTARDASGVVVTMISDNYFGYCKKEVKTQLGFAVNLMGIAEEEHAGGTLAFSSYDLGEDFRLNPRVEPEVEDHTFSEVVERFGDRLTVKPEGYAIDREHPEIVFVPETSLFTMNDLRITWPDGKGDEQKIKLLADKVYILPSGYKVQLVKPGKGRRWRLIGTRAQPCMCHKPCTVSGGGKSEISKSIADAIIHAPFYVTDLQKGFDQVEEILNREYGMRFSGPSLNRENGRALLSPDRSLGSVIKLFTPSDEFNEEHNAFVESIPTEIKALVLLVKRFYKPEWGENWRERFSVDRINGIPGHELRYRRHPVISSYLRVGYDEEGSWRVFSLRTDFAPARKIQMEDDITASAVVPREALSGSVGSNPHPSLKFTHNCEYRLFQRPDDAVIRGYDRQTEIDMSGAANFFSNYEPLDRDEARDMIEDAVRFDYFSEPMQKFITGYSESESSPDFFVSSANPRIVDGKPSKNPRYLQTRLDLINPDDAHIAETGLRLFRRLQPDDPLYTPVDVVCPGRRNNPPEGEIRPLCVFNPIHYLSLPEVFMEFISSMTGKSPSTTGAGSEGALTKAPFNALLPIHDLNAALVSYMVSGYHPFITAAGWVGPKYRVDHDISLLAPEMFSRMKRTERDPAWLIENGMLEPVPDVEFEGRELPGHILGYRITQAFVHRFMARIFSSPTELFPDDMLRPEEQDLAVYADGLDNILATHRRVSENYFADGSIEFACPPLRALLHIMRDGEYEGMDLRHPGIRKMFFRDEMLSSEWYLERLESQRLGEISRAERMLGYLESLVDGPQNLDRRIDILRTRLDHCRSQGYRESLLGTIGRDPALGLKEELES